MSNFISENTNPLVIRTGVSHVRLENSDQTIFEISLRSRKQEEDIKRLLLSVCLVSSECSFSVGTAKSTSHDTHLTTLLHIYLH
jgi:hypothetical protein